MKRPWALVMLALVLLLSHRAALAQANTGDAQLNGSVRDQTGGVIVKASASLRNVANNQVYKASSNNVGFYILTNVPPGNYDLTIESQALPSMSRKAWCCAWPRWRRST